MDVKKRVRDAERVSKILEDPFFVEMLDSIEQAVVRMWIESGSNEYDKREDLYREMHGLRALKARMKHIIDLGKIAEKELEK